MFFEEYEVSANALRLMDAENAARILEHVEDYEVRNPAGRWGGWQNGLMIGAEWYEDGNWMETTEEKHHRAFSHRKFDRLGELSHSLEGWKI